MFWRGAAKQLTCLGRSATGRVSSLGGRLIGKASGLIFRRDSICFKMLARCFARADSKGGGGIGFGGGGSWAKAIAGNSKPNLIH